MESESFGNGARLPDQAMRDTHISMVDPEVVRQMRALADMKWSSRRIARELGVNRGTVKRYLPVTERA